MTYEQFKADILQWKNTHREEYSRFARLMTNGDERQYLAICQAIFRQLPGIRREWELLWNDDSTEGFENIDLQFKENAVLYCVVHGKIPVPVRLGTEAVLDRYTDNLSGDKRTALPVGIVRFRISCLSADHARNQA